MLPSLATGQRVAGRSGCVQLASVTLGVTFAYWLLAVRRGLAAPRTILPLFLASIVALRAALA